MIVAVGGQARNIGKTTLMCNLIAATRDLGWTAIKITQFGHGQCAAEGESCECGTGESAHPYALDQETAPGSRDSQRYLAAGAVRAYWLRTRQGELAEAMPALRRILAASARVIVESNSILGLLQPDLYFPVCHPGQADFKQSARIHLRRATRIVLASPGPLPPGARGIPAIAIEEWPVLIPLLRQAAGSRMTSDSRPASLSEAVSEP